MDIEMEGLTALKARFDGMWKVLDKPEFEDRMHEISKKIRNKMKSRAPLGPTGNLRRGIVAKKFGRRIRNNPAVFVAVDYRIAPHAHLVEYGTVRASPHPFFRPTIDASRADFIKGMEKAVRNTLEEYRTVRSS